jgi:16S rRNA C1402 (ribose-2'-O) methylase RsmI
MIVESDEHPGYPSANRNDELVAQMHDLVKNDRKLTICEVTEEVRFFYGLCQVMLTEELTRRHVSGKFILQLLIQEQKENCLSLWFLTALNLQKQMKVS